MNLSNIINFLFLFFLLFLFSCKSIKDINNNIEISSIEYEIDNNNKISDYDPIIKNNIFDYYSNATSFNWYSNSEKFINEFNIKKSSNINQNLLNIIIFNNILYNLDLNSNLSIYDLETGEELDKIKINLNLDNEFSYPTSIAYSKGYFYASYSDGIIIKFDLYGEILWQISINNILKTPIKIHNNYIILIISNKIIGLDIDTGAITWEFTYENDNPLNTHIGSIISNNNIIYFLLPNGRLGEIDTFISLKNDSKFTNLILDYNYFDNKYFFHRFDNLLSFIENKKYLYTYNLNKGIFLIQKFDIKNIESYFYINNALITIDKNNILYAHNIINKKIFWKLNLSEILKDNIKILEIYKQNNNIYIFINNGKIIQLDLKNGDLIDIFDIKTKDIKSINLINNYIILNHNNNKRIIISQK